MRLLANVAVCLLASLSVTQAQTKVHIVEETLAVKAQGDSAQDPLQYDSMPAPLPPRHRQEQAHLQKRLSKKTGTYNAYHPRYRLFDALWGYLSYRERNMVELDRWRSLYKSVSKKQKNALEHSIQYTQKLSNLEELIYTNAAFCRSIVTTALEFYDIPRSELDVHIAEAQKAKRVADRISVSMTLKHFVRDWADEGSKERKDAFPCILGIMRSLKSTMSEENKDLKILMPGSGLGRLGTEVDNLGGFETTLNEWSTYMNAAYRFLLTQPHATPFSSTLHPFIDGLSHHATTSDLLRPITFPNIVPSPSVLLVEGDFLSAFADKTGYYDIIITHFFIDTARNLLSYFDTIERLLRKGGRWVNLGPLLYGTGPFVQLSLDEILVVVEGMGFEFENVSVESGEGDDDDVESVCGKLTFDYKKVRSTEAEYGFNGRALTKNAYMAQVWVARKV